MYGPSRNADWIGSVRSDVRWYLKKGARHGVAIASWALGGTDKGAAPAGPRVRVLTYHRFGDSAKDPFCVTQRDFDAQMRYLAETGRAIGLADLDAMLAGERMPRDGSVVVTIDDGFRSTRTVAQPVLSHYGIAAVSYVTAGLIEAGDVASTLGDCIPEPYMTWREIEEFAAAGGSVGSHAFTHRSLGRMSPDEATEQAARSRERLQERLGRSITSFAYPFGTRADYSAATALALRRCGYTTGFTSQHGAVTRTSDALELPRVKVEGGEGMTMFRLLVSGGLDNWRLIDRALWKLQAAERG